MVVLVRYEASFEAAKRNRFVPSSKATRLCAFQALDTLDRVRFHVRQNPHIHTAKTYENDLRKLDIHTYYHRKIWERKN